MKWNIWWKKKLHKKEFHKRYSQQYGTTFCYYEAFQKSLLNLNIFTFLLLILPFYKTTKHRAHIYGFLCTRMWTKYCHCLR